MSEEDYNKEQLRKKEEMKDMEEAIKKVIENEKRNEK